MTHNPPSEIGLLDQHTAEDQLGKRGSSRVSTIYNCAILSLATHRKRKDQVADVSTSLGRRNRRDDHLSKRRSEPQEGFHEEEHLGTTLMNRVGGLSVSVETDTATRRGN